jgi:uncharacterized RDD family membrane protein YckC
MPYAKWYYGKDDQRHGPVSKKQLTTLLRSGKVLPTDLVWREGLDDWQPAASVDGLSEIERVGQAGPPPLPPKKNGEPDGIRLSGTGRSLGEAVGQAETDAVPERVGFGLRFGALAIDVGVFLPFGLIIGILFAIGSEGEMDLEPEPAFMFVLLVALLGYGLWEGQTGAAAGKRLLGLVVARADGTRASEKTLMLRYAVKFGDNIIAVLALAFRSEVLSGISTLFGLVLAIGFLLVLKPERQALHDRLVKTAVFRAKDVKDAPESDSDAASKQGVSS